jgi:ribosomal protein S18 acetylase RimI-like enzyme
MSHVSTPTRRQVALRKAGRFDLWPLVRIADQTPALRWVQQDFEATLQADGGASTVAEVNGQVVGFILYRVSPPPDRMAWGTIKKLLGRCWPWKPCVRTAPRRVDLLYIAVVPEWQRHGIGRALLEDLHHQFQEPGDILQATVPETNLPAQLFLWDAGYKAVRVLPGYHEGEDGYAMERQGC